MGISHMKRRNMQFGEAVRISLDSLWAHKLRSILTLLGVVIGVMAVIAVVSFVGGLNSYVAEKVFNLGADVFLIGKVPAVITDIDTWIEAQKRKDIRYEDFEAVRANCAGCPHVGATLFRLGETHVGNNSLKDSFVRGWTASMQRIYDLEVVQGRMFTELEDHRGLHVCLVGPEIVEQLLPFGNPIGQEVRLDNQVYQIIGVGKKQGSVLGQSRDNWVLIPLQTFMRVYGSRQSLRIWVKANGTENMPAAMDEARLIMRARRHNLLSQKDDFVIETNDTFIGLWKDFSQTFFIVVIAIASIALVVGGIVIMNIMLVSVTERTREIGLRKSVGARSQDILIQFLIESSTMAAVGGLWGVVFGVGLAKSITHFTDFPSQVLWWAVMAALLMATSVGLFFGIYPASRAARLDPVVALRAE